MTRIKLIEAPGRSRANQPHAKPQRLQRSKQTAFATSRSLRALAIICIFALAACLAGCQQPAPTGQAVPRPAGQAAPQAPRAKPGPYRVLFDASHGETAGNADWVISTSQPDPLGENAAPRAEADWTGALSAWGVALQQTGRYQLKTLPRGGRASYGSRAEPLDLANFDVFIVPEPNIRFSADEKAAILAFVQGGGGLFMIADHDGSDRNSDGADSLQIWNELMRDGGNPFGFSFDARNIERDNPRNIPADAATDPVIRGPFGRVTGSIVRGGTTATIDPGANPSVRGLIYRTGADTGGTGGVFFLTSALGKGRVAAWGDSSPIDDGTGTSYDQLYDGWDDAGGSDAILALNATEWLARGGANSGPAVATPSAQASATATAGQTATIENGDFERGLDGWQARGDARASADRAHGGRQAARLCGANNCQASISQTIDIPAGARSATLGYAVAIVTQETRHPYDFLTVELRGPDGRSLDTLQRLSDADAAKGWRAATFDLSAYAGQTVDLVFSAASGRVAPTTFFLDDVSVVVAQ